MTGERSTPARRARPAQARSVATVERILEAASAVLVERGLPGFNTNAVADVAGVNVGTLYHYFADKNAILLELFERDQAARTEFFAEQVPSLVTTDDMGGWMHRLIESILFIRRREQATAALRRACRAVPELIEAEEQSSAEMASMLESALRARIPALPAPRAAAASRALIEIGRALLDLTVESGAAGFSLQAELEAMLTCYLRDLETSP